MKLHVTAGIKLLNLISVLFVKKKENKTYIQTNKQQQKPRKIKKTKQKTPNKQTKNK
jgi:hypothetical protein